MSPASGHTVCVCTYTQTCAPSLQTGRIHGSLLLKVTLLRDMREQNGMEQHSLTGLYLHC